MDNDHTDDPNEGLLGLDAVDAIQVLAYDANDALEPAGVFPQDVLDAEMRRAHAPQKKSQKAKPKLILQKSSHRHQNAPNFYLNKPSQQMHTTIHWSVLL